MSTITIDWKMEDGSVGSFFTEEYEPGRYALWRQDCSDFKYPEGYEDIFIFTNVHTMKKIAEEMERYKLRDLEDWLHQRYRHWCYEGKPQLFVLTRRRVNEEFDVNLND